MEHVFLEYESQSGNFVEVSGKRVTIYCADTGKVHQDLTCCEFKAQFPALHAEFMRAQCIAQLALA